MRTPAGAECAFYYEDMHRGRAIQECRVKRGARSAAWTAADCERCPVPAVLLANGSPHLVLELTVRRGIFGFGKRMSVVARCGKHGTSIEDPFVGCATCSSEMLTGLGLDDLGSE